MDGFENVWWAGQGLPEVGIVNMGQENGDENMEQKNGSNQPNIGEGAEKVSIAFGVSLAMNKQAMGHYRSMGEEE